MSTEETHFYTDKCDRCGLTHERKFGETRVIEEYCYGFYKNIGSSSRFASSSEVQSYPEHSVHVCPDCCNMLTGAIDFKIKENK